MVFSLHPAPRTRGGFTLIELLVVVAIVAILIGLTMASVQRVRSSAAKTQCQNNLRQLGIALHSYHDTFKRFPPGVSSKGETDPMPFLGWTARLLPYLEQPALWDETVAAFRVEKFFLTPPHPGHKPLPIARCPSDPRRQTVSVAGKATQALTSYLGVEGTRAIKQDGLLYLDSSHTFAEITDGASNTLLVGERPASVNLFFGWWYGGWGQEKDGCLDLTLGVRTKNRSYLDTACPPGPLPFAAPKIDDPCGHFQFWSPHPGGAHFAFADGSVRFLKYSADSVLPALATRAGGESVAVPD